MHTKVFENHFFVAHDDKVPRKKIMFIYKGCVLSAYNNNMLTTQEHPICMINTSIL